MKVLPLLSAVHMDEKIWDRPQIFNPQRFVDADGKFFSHPHFIPFQSGKR